MPKTVEDIRDEILKALHRDSYSKSIPLAAFNDTKRLELVEAVLTRLETIEARLFALEQKTQLM